MPIMENIRGKQEIIDPSYRYKMEKMVFQKEKTKTCITNLDKIATDIKIPDHSHIVTFLKKKLAIAIVVKKDSVIITNDVDTRLIQAALYEFIEYFVLCKTCKLPELTYNIDKKHLVVCCRSCGAVNNIEDNKYTEAVIKNMEIHLGSNKKKKIKIIDDENKEN